MSRPAIKYTSQWNRQSSAQQPVKYVKFTFRKTVCRLFPNGDTEFEELPGEYEIEVPKGWSQYAQGGVPKGGYLSKGFYKYAISVRHCFIFSKKY
jgi:hypothetical protein